MNVPRKFYFRVAIVSVDGPLLHQKHENELKYVFQGRHNMADTVRRAHDRSFLINIISPLISKQLD